MWTSIWAWWSPILQTVVGAVMLGLIVHSANLVRKAYPKRKEQFHSAGRVAYVVFLDLGSAAWAVWQGHQIATRTSSFAVASAWFLLLYTLGWRVWMAYMDYCTKESQRVTAGYRKVGETLDQDKPAIQKRLDVAVQLGFESFRGPRVSYSLLYAIVSTAFWLWVALYIGIIRHLPRP
jgi:hypothetical protein